VDVLELEISVTHGSVSESTKQYAAEKVTQLARFTRRPILYAELRLGVEPHRAIERPAVAEATLDVNGQIVRAHVAARDLLAAIDLLEERLRRRIERQARRTSRGQHRTNAASGGAWRHGDPRTQRPEYFDRPIEEREVVRHKTFALEPMTCDEAAFDLDMLGHDFYLFTEIETGADSVIYHAPDDGHLEVMHASPNSSRPDGVAVPLVVSPHHPPELTLADAEERLDTSHEPFVFFVNADTQRGNVVYRRYDGHYGLITPA
jgi:ribosomal subunit interface protein